MADQLHTDLKRCPAFPISQIESLLDGFTRGDVAASRRLAEMQLHFLVCEYCGSLLRSAEQLRDGFGTASPASTSASTPRS